jgi:hypothetical protein
MTSSTRTGRRRRMLHEGASAPTAVVDGDQPIGVKVRYTPPAESASFATASRVLPRTSAALGGLVAGLLGVTALIGWLSGVGATTGEADSSVALLLNIDRPGSLAAWWEACLWLAVAGQCVVLFGMRRHRTSDLGGSYRWWLFAAAAATGMSLCSATHANTVIAEQLASLTGFSPIGGDLLWKMFPGGLLAMGAAAWAVMEVRECSTAATFAGATGVSVAVALASSAGFVPSLGPALTPNVIGAVATTAAAVLTLGMLLSYSRRIVRESQGDVAPPVTVKKASAASGPALEIDDAPEHQDSTDQPTHQQAVSKKRSTAAYYSEDDDFQNEEEQASAKASAMRKTKREPSRPKLAEETAPESSRWVSGAEDYQENYDDEAPQMRKRTKAERKALRREKERRAA